MNIDLFADIICPLQLIRDNPRHHPENSLCVKQCRWYNEEAHDCVLNMLHDRLLEISTTMQAPK